MTLPVVGPYLASARLGAGGMGEVWRGYDPRLDRQVALKQLRRDRAADPIWRQRLRNEARAVARLSHPAIVQVHDLVEQPEGDWMVMELVEGVSLARLLARGPLAAAQLVVLGRDIAAALVEAHGKGILHRDLKAENVMVTRQGQAKVLDFGLAKWSRAAAPAPGSPSASLSAEGVVLGTLRAMSPEQALGHELDARSDLFALGSLLYEMATGGSPFAAETEAATLMRLCTIHPAPLDEVVRGGGGEERALLEGLSALVDRLLAKEREARPGSAAEVVRALERLGGREHGGRERRATATAELGRRAIAAEWRERGDGGSAPAHPEGETTGIPGGVAAEAAEAAGVAAGAAERKAAPSSEATAARAGAAAGVTPKAEWRRWVARGLAIAIAIGAALAALAARTGATRELSEAPRYVAVPMPEVHGDPPSGEAELLAAGVRAAVLAELAARPRLAALSADDAGLDATSPRAVASALAADELLTTRLDCHAAMCRATLTRLEGRDGRVRWLDSFELPLADPLLAARAVTTSLRHGYAEHAPASPAAALVDTVRAEDYEAYLRLFLRQQRREAGADAEPVLDELSAIRRRSPRFVEAYLLEAQLLGLRFFDGRDADDLERALARASEARTMAPRDPRPLMALLELAIPAERLDEAEEALRALEALAPGQTPVMVRRALYLERRGAPAEALAQLRRAAALRPSWPTLLDLANLEQRLGELAAARRTLAELLERFPGHVKGLTMLAQLELLSGSAARAAQLYEELVRRSPGFAELSNLGLAEMLLGRYVRAADSLRRAAELAPRSAAALLNLADAEALAGRADEARAGYEQALALAAADPAPDFWQTATIRAQALAHLGRGAEARVALAGALADQPENPQVAFEGALVLALIGDLDEARRLRARALGAGLEARWFELPWFAALGAGGALSGASEASAAPASD